MWIIETIIVAFSMFSAVPMPRIEWNAKNMRYAMSAFPLVGLIIGLISWGFLKLCSLFPVPGLVQGAVFCLIPVFITGGIHLDGYCDTCDALASNQPMEKKLEILKDPNTGAFAVIRLCAYFILYFALWATLPGFFTEQSTGGEAVIKGFPIAELILGYCLSRCLSGLAIASFPLAKNTGLAHTFATAADKNKVRVILLIELGALVGTMTYLSGFGLVMVLAAFLANGYYYLTAKRKFGGITGDLAGWFLQKAELWMLIAMWLVAFLSEVVV